MYDYPLQLYSTDRRFMEVMPADVEKSDFLKESMPTKQPAQRIVPSRWASKEKFIESRAKIAQRKVLRTIQKAELIPKQKDNKKPAASKKEKERNPISSQHDSVAQNAAWSAQKSIPAEEDFYQSSKNLQRRTGSSQQLKSIYFNKTNGFHMTKPKLKKSAPFNESLPTISTPHNSQLSSASLFSTKEVKIIEFGIFSASKDSEAFLSRFRGVVQQQFNTGIDLDNIFDLNRLEYHLLNQIRKSTK